jgi:hypothetical protein
MAEYEKRVRKKLSDSGTVAPSAPETAVSASPGLTVFPFMTVCKFAIP